jgi:hypothetical protein
VLFYPNTGKTLLFHVLQNGNSNVHTVTSSEPNTAMFTPHLLDKYQAMNTPVSSSGVGQRAIEQSIQSFEFIDSPGHPSLQNSIIQQYIYSQTGGARAILFVVNNTIVHDSKQLQYTSQLLYSIMTSKNLINNKVPVLLVINHFNTASTSKQSAVDNQTVVKQLGKFTSVCCFFCSATVHQRLA